MHFDWKEIEKELEPILSGLEGISLDRRQIERFAREIAEGTLSRERNRLRESPEPAGPDDVQEIEELPEESRASYTEMGRSAIERGEIAMAVLNGGMATRFGGAVKGIVEVAGGRTFLEIKLARARRLGPVPIAVMNSFATHRETLRHLEARGAAEGVETFLQGVSLRLTPEGGLFRDDQGRVSPYAPGHGDFPDAIVRSGVLDALERRGVRAVMLSNVDNLLAELDPLIAGYHLAHGLPLTVETARARENDKGGAPARVAGRLQIVEDFRFPESYDLRRNRYFNTNTFWFTTAALRATHPLHYFYVEKRVGERVAVQLERLVGEVSAFVDTAYLASPRSGPHCRFRPVKEPADLEALRADPEVAARIDAV